MSAPIGSTSAAIAAAVDVPGSALATFAAGCFWGTERYFQKQFGKACFRAGPDGVAPPGKAPTESKILFMQVGYMSGALQRPEYAKSCPGYKAITSGTTGFAEVAHVVFNSSLVTYEELVRFFFRMHNPTTLNSQGNDRGTQYRSAIFAHSEQQAAVAARIKAELMTGEGSEAAAADHAKMRNAFKTANIVTTIEPATTFFPAEEYHQLYLDANPDGYCNHRIYW